MNVLILYEYRLASANYNIANNIVEEFKCRGINVFIGYIIKDELNDDIKYINNERFVINDIKSYLYISKKYDNSWNKKRKINKLLYFLIHPKSFFSYFFYRIDERNGYKDGKKRIEKLCVDLKMDYIIGFSAPHSIERLIDNLNVSIPVSIFRLDPYAFNPCLPSSEFNKRIGFERDLLSRIHRLYTNKLIIKDLLTDNYLCEYSSKMISVEFPLITEKDDIKDYSRIEKHIFDKSLDSVYLLHAGTFYDDIRNPKLLVDFMKLLPEKYVLLVAGLNSADIRKYDSDIRHRIIDLGCLNRSEIDSVINDCDFLISFNNKNTNMIPSKLFECINSRKPFINICHSDNCPTIEYVDGYDLAFSVVISHPFPQNELISFMEKNKDKKSSRDQILNRYEKCTVKYVAKQIINEMDSFASKR